MLGDAPNGKHEPWFWSENFGHYQFSVIKSLPFTLIIVPLFEQLSPLSAQTQIIIINAPRWWGLNKVLKGRAGLNTPAQYSAIIVFSDIHLYVSNSSFSGTRSFSKPETLQQQCQDHFFYSVKGKRGSLTPLQLPLHPRIRLLSQIHRLCQQSAVCRAVHLNRYPVNESVYQHALLRQHMF